MPTLILNGDYRVKVAGSLVEILSGANTHEYLGRLLVGYLKKRSEVELAHRLQIAWGKFHTHKEILTNIHVSLKLRLKYFDAIISPAALFGLASLPLVASQIQRLNVVQRRMLRAVVGWVAVDGNDWQGTMRRMNCKVNFALEKFPVCTWSDSFFKRKFRFAAHVACSKNWCKFPALWDPSDDWQSNFTSCPGRTRGRPQQRWDDILNKFCEGIYDDPSWFQHARDCVNWFPLEIQFVQFCREQFSL